MRIQWTPRAADDLESIADYLAEKNPVKAAAVVRQIYDAAYALRQFPNRGRAGRKAGTRELVLGSLPWIIIYEVAGQTVHITRVLHGSQRWP